MCGRGNRQQLGNPLHHTKDRDLEITQRDEAGIDALGASVSHVHIIWSDLEGADRPRCETVTVSGVRAELSGLAKAPEITRHDGRNRFGDYAERFQRAALAPGFGGDDVIALEQFDLVGRDRRLRQKLSERRLELHDLKRHRHKKPPASGGGEDEFHQFAERAHVRSAEFVDRARLGLAIDRLGNRFRHVADKHRLKSRVAAAHERQRRSDARERRKAVEEIIFGTKHDRRPHDRRRRLRHQHAPLAFRFRAGVVRGRIRVSADCRDVDETGAGGFCRKRHRFGSRRPGQHRSAAHRARTGCRPD